MQENDSRSVPAHLVVNVDIVASDARHAMLSTLLNGSMRSEFLPDAIDKQFKAPASGTHIYFEMLLILKELSNITEYASLSAFMKPLRSLEGKL